MLLTAGAIITLPPIGSLGDKVEPGFPTGVVIAPAGHHSEGARSATRRLRFMGSADRYITNSSSWVTVRPNRVHSTIPATDSAGEWK